MLSVYEVTRIRISKITNANNAGFEWPFPAFPRGLSAMGMKESWHSIMRAPSWRMKTEKGEEDAGVYAVEKART